MYSSSGSSSTSMRVIFGEEKAKAPIDHLSTHNASYFEVILRVLYLPSFGTILVMVLNEILSKFEYRGMDSPRVCANRYSYRPTDGPLWDEKEKTDRRRPILIRRTFTNFSSDEVRT